MKRISAILSVAAVLSGMLAGCDTQSQNKQAAIQRWDISTAQAKIKTIDSLIENGRIDEARRTLEKCIQADPKSAHAHFLMGRVHVIENRTEDARVSFAETIALNASHDAAWFHLGVLYDMENDRDRAMEAYQKALSLKPAEPEYIIAMAQAHIQTGQNEQARELLENELKKQPANRDLILAMAELTRRSGHLDQTATYYERILLTQPKDQDVLESLGYCYVAMNEWEKAAKTFEKLLSVLNDDARKETVLETLAMCASNAGRYGQAMNYYDRLSVMQRDDATVWLNMAQAALGADLYDRAAANAQRALKIRPSWPQAYAVLGSAQYLQTKYNEAIRSFSYARNDDEVGGFAWFMTGRCYAQLGQTAKAEVAYRKAGDLNSDNPLINRFLNEDSDAL